MIKKIIKRIKGKMGMVNYSASIIAAAQKAGIDPNLALAVAQTESSMNPSAISSAGAIGLFQLMPSSFPGGNINDPLTNIDLGVNYLSSLLDQYGGDVTLALAAYNAGSGNVAKYGGVPPFAETQNYVAKIIGLLGLSPSDSVSLDGNSSSGSVDLSMVAIVAGVGIAGYLLMR
jgi:hypothetical protein